MTAIFLLISVVIFKAPVQALGQIQEKTGIRLTPFQKNIQTCLQSNEAVSKIQTLSDLYDVLDKAYPLRTSETVFREILFRKDDEIRKIKFEKGKVRLFKVSDDKSIKLINSDARQKGLTEESSINQLLVGAEVRSDWTRIKEHRFKQTLLEYSRQQGRITALLFKIGSTSKRLDCSHLELSDICLCRP